MAFRRRTSLVLGLAVLAGLAFANPAGAVFPGEAGKIAFASNRDGGNFEIYVMSADGIGQTNVTNHSGFDGQPHWAPDGDRIAFSSFRDGNFELYVTNQDGTGLARLTTTPWHEQWPAWSPDGTKLAFSSNAGGDFEIYSMNLDGSDLVQLTDNSIDDLSPVWSPDGTMIAFASASSGASQIWIMNADGSNLHLLTNDSAFWAVPDWSADGMSMVFQRENEIYSINVDGTNLTNLTTHPAVDIQPAHAPDASKILFSSNRNGGFHVFRMNADGSGIEQLTSLGTVNFQADWGRLPAPTTTADAAVNVVVNGDVVSRAATKMVMVDVTNVGDLPLTVDKVVLEIMLNGNPAPGAAEATSPPSGKIIEPGDTLRVQFQWRYPRGSVAPGDVIVFSSSASMVEPEITLANNQDSESRTAK